MPGWYHSVAAREPAEPVVSPRNPGIDRLRGLAIVLVVLNHLGLRIPLRQTELAEWLPAALLRALNFNGYEAVFVFFVISGFLIAGNALRRWGSLAAIDERHFYVRRFARIAPCLVALLGLLSMLHWLGAPDYVIHQPGQSLPGALTAAIGLHLNWYEAKTGYLSGNWDVLWSLSIEEAFYLGFPCVCLLLRRQGVLWALLALLALSLPWTRAALHGNEIWLEKAYLPGMAAIAMGVLGALLANAAQPPERTVRMLGWLGAFGFGAVLLDGRALWHWLRDGYMLVLTAATLCLLLSCHWRARNVAASPWRLADWLQSWGRLSYEIYLSHMFVVYAVVRLWKQAGGDLHGGWLWYAPALLLSWWLGQGIERLLSAPCERWLRQRLLPAPAPSAGTAAIPISRGGD